MAKKAARLVPILKAIDSFVPKSNDNPGEHFTKSSLVDRGDGEVTGAVLLSVLPRLERMSLIKRIPHTKPFEYVRLENLTDQFHTTDLFDNFFSPTFWAAANKDGDNTPPPEPQVEEIEIDPFELLDKMPEDDVANLFSAYLRAKRAMISPLQTRIDHLEADVRFKEGQRVQAEQRHASEMSAIREELRTEREANMSLRTELESEKGLRVQAEQKMKVIRVETNKQITKDSSSTGGYHATPVKMHRKPLMTHAPATVLHRKRH